MIGWLLVGRWDFRVGDNPSDDDFVPDFKLFFNQI